MKEKIRFTKMHGCGNDYIYINMMEYEIADPQAAAIAWSDRHKGIGSDGLVLIDKSSMPEADFSMRIFNADGSEAMMCGNASRCIGKYLYADFQDGDPLADPFRRQDTQPACQRWYRGKRHRRYGRARS